MKSTILTALLSLTLISTSAFAADIKTSQYSGNTTLDLTYFAAGWGGGDDYAARERCTLGGTIFTGIISLGLMPLFGCPNNDKEKSSVEDVALNAIFNETESGRGTIRLNSATVKNCAGFSGLIYAEQDGFGIYDLYLSKEAWTNGEKIGSATKTNDSLEMSFSQADLIMTSLGKKGKACVFKLGSNFHIQMSKK